MSSIPSRFGRSKYLQQPQKTESVKSVYASHHATVNCHECNRTMVPRVVSYYGQPLKSISPFCGATFMKFPSGLQKFWRRFHTRTLSFAVFYRLAIVALGFSLIGFFSSEEVLPHNLGRVAIFGTIIFAPLACAELIFQCVEQLAAKLSHESNYYWAILVLLAFIIANQFKDFAGYIVLIFIAMFIRGLISGLAQVSKTTSKTYLNN